MSKSNSKEMAQRPTPHTTSNGGIRIETRELFTTVEGRAILEKLVKSTVVQDTRRART